MLRDTGVDASLERWNERTADSLDMFIAFLGLFAISHVCTQRGLETLRICENAHYFMHCDNPVFMLYV